MTVIFSDNFDSEAEGTSPPANWSNESLTTMEVDDAQAHSNPHSMKCAGNGYGHHDESDGFTSDKVTLWLYFDTANEARAIISQQTTGNNSSGSQLTYLYFAPSGNIEYFDGASFIDTGYDFTTGWHKIEIVHDMDSDTFDCWYDDVQVITDGDFRNVGDSVKSIHIRCVTSNLWVDDIQFGESSGWTGKIGGVTDPAEVGGVEVANIASVNGVA